MAKAKRPHGEGESSSRSAPSKDSSKDPVTFVREVLREGETTAVDEFSTRVWALEFGDWLWEELVAARASTDAEVLAEKRDEWEQSKAMAKYEGPGSLRKT